jgi:hypothetical protein
LERGPYDAIVLLVTHTPYVTLGAKGLLKALSPDGILFDLKGVIDPAVVSTTGASYLTL